MNAYTHIHMISLLKEIKTQRRSIFCKQFTPFFHHVMHTELNNYITPLCQIPGDIQGIAKRRLQGEPLHVLIAWR